MPMKWGRHGRDSVETAKRRFLAKVCVRADGCWIWTGSKHVRGRYGTVGLMGKTWMAHRASWMLFRGEDPGTLCICHKCDVGMCVNPDHLFLGTVTDNCRDMERKGRARHPVGERHGRARLTWRAAADILALHKQGVPIRELSRRFGVARPSIDRIVHGVGWVHQKWSGTPPWDPSKS